MFGLPFRPAPKSVLERLRSYRHRAEKNAEYAAAAPDDIEQRARAAEGAPEAGLRELLAAETAARQALEARVAKLEKRAEIERRWRKVRFDMSRMFFGTPDVEMAEPALPSPAVDEAVTKPKPAAPSLAVAEAADAQRAIQIIEAELGPLDEGRAAKAVARALLLVHGFDGVTALLRL